MLVSIVTKDRSFSVTTDDKINSVEDLLRIIKDAAVYCGWTEKQWEDGVADYYYNKIRSPSLKEGD